MAPEAEPLTELIDALSAVEDEHLCTVCQPDKPSDNSMDDDFHRRKCARWAAESLRSVISDESKAISCQ